MKVLYWIAYKYHDFMWSVSMCDIKIKKHHNKKMELLKKMPEWAVTYESK